MKKWSLVITEDDDGQISLSARSNGGFHALELLGLLEMKKCDILAQLSPESTFKRVLIEKDGSEFEIKEEN